MIIQVNTDRNIDGDQELAEHIKAELSNSLERLSEQITRIEVHLSDENSDKKFGAEDKCCLLEARLAGLKPIAVSHLAATLDQAVDGAIDKLIRSIDKTLGRLDSR